MRKTTIVHPYVGENRHVYQEYFKRVQKHLDKLETDVTFDEFLDEVGLSEDDYMKAVQTS